MGRSWLAIASACALTSVAACGLDVAGVAIDIEAGPSDASGTDAIAPPAPSVIDGDVTSDGGGLPIDAGDACSIDTCGVVVPAGWAAIAFGPGTSACPAGFGSNDVLESPAPTAGACTCTAVGCSITQPSCNIGSITSTYDNNVGTASCNTSGAVKPLNNGACTTYTANFSQHAGMPAPAPTGGSCVAKSVADSSKATAQKSRVCAAPSCADLCAAPAPFTTCILASGDHPCPATTPIKHLVGTTIDVTCGDCSTCTLSGASCTGTMSFFTDGNCGTLTKTIGYTECVSVAGVSSGSYRWAGTPVGAQCNPSGPPAGAAALVPSTLSTICCK